MKVLMFFFSFVAKSYLWTWICGTTLLKQKKLFVWSYAKEEKKIRKNLWCYHKWTSLKLKFKYNPRRNYVVTSLTISRQDQSSNILSWRTPDDLTRQGKISCHERVISYVTPGKISILLFYSGLRQPIDSSKRDIPCQSSILLVKQRDPAGKGLSVTATKNIAHTVLFFSKTIFKIWKNGARGFINI